MDGSDGWAVDGWAGNGWQSEPLAVAAIPGLARQGSAQWGPWLDPCRSATAGFASFIIETVGASPLTEP